MVQRPQSTSMLLLRLLPHLSLHQLHREGVAAAGGGSIKGSAMNGGEIAGIIAAVAGVIGAIVILLWMCTKRPCSRQRSPGNDAWLVSPSLEDVMGYTRGHAGLGMRLNDYINRLYYHDHTGRGMGLTVREGG